MKIVVVKKSVLIEYGGSNPSLPTNEKVVLKNTTFFVPKNRLFARNRVDTRKFLENLKCFKIVYNNMKKSIIIYNFGDILGIRFLDIITFFINLSNYL